MTTTDDSGSGQGAQTQDELRAKADLLRRQLNELEPAVRLHRQKVLTVLAIGGFCFVVCAAAAGQSGAFAGLAVVVFAATYFALQRITLHSPAEEARKLRTEVERIAWQLSAGGQQAAGTRARLTPDEEREAVKAYGRSMSALGFISAFLFAAGFLAFTIAAPHLPDTGPEDQLAFGVVALVASGASVVAFRLGRTRLERILGRTPAGIQTLRAMLIGRL